MKPIKTLVVGYGLSARAFHLPFLLSNAAYEVVGIVQPRGGLAKEALPHLQHFRTLEAAIGELDFELAVIAVPNQHHAPMAKQVLLADKHVLVEKPFATTVSEAEELCELALERNRVLSVYHNRRWDGDFQTLKKLLGQEAIGMPVSFVSRFDRFRPLIKKGWKEELAPGSGILFDLAPHLVDQCLQLWGWPNEVYAHLRTERKEALTHDAFDIFLYYASLTAHLSAGSLVSAPLPRFVMLGSAGSYTKWGMDPQEALLRQGASPITPGWGEEPSSNWGTLVKGDHEETWLYPSQKGNYNEFFIKLAKAIRENDANPVPPQEALQVMKIIELAQRSYQEGRRIDC